MFSEFSLMAEECAMPPDAAALMMNTLHEKRYIADTLSVDDLSHDWNFVFSILFGFGCAHCQLYNSMRCSCLP
jgi:hypothetical protein